MTKFIVEGPFSIHCRRHGRGYQMVYSGFWTSLSKLRSLRQKKGIYIFGIRAGSGFTPIYVGRASDTRFETECFNKPNRRKYRQGIVCYKKCTPMLLLIVHPRKKGRYNKKAIDEIESFFIQLCADKNPKLQNVRKRKSPHWSIAGVLRCSRKGRRTEAETCLKRMARL